MHRGLHLQPEKIDDGFSAHQVFRGFVQQHPSTVWVDDPGVAIAPIAQAGRRARSFGLLRRNVCHVLLLREAHAKRDGGWREGPTWTAPINRSGFCIYLNIVLKISSSDATGMAVSKKVVRRGRPSGSHSTDPRVASALGKAIASLRVAVGMSQEALALAASIGRSNISMIETGRTTPNFVGVVKIAAALNCSLSALMQEFEQHYAEGQEPQATSN